MMIRLIFLYMNVDEIENNFKAVSALHKDYKLFICEKI
jgi:hypothetical protein